MPQNCCLQETCRKNVDEDKRTWGSTDVHEHDYRRCECGTAVARNGEQFEELGPSISADLLLRLKQHMYV